jgi:hypothetical protein
MEHDSVVVSDELNIKEEGNSAAIAIDSIPASPDIDRPRSLGTASCDSELHGSHTNSLLSANVDDEAASSIASIEISEGGDLSESLIEASILALVVNPSVASQSQAIIGTHEPGSMHSSSLPV